MTLHTIHDIIRKDWIVGCERQPRFSRTINRKSIMQKTQEEILAEFLESKKSYFNAPFGVKELLKKRVYRSIKKLQAAVKGGAGFEELRKLSEKLRIPIEPFSRPPSQIKKKTNVAGPFEIWWEVLYAYSKIGIGDSLHEAFEDAKKRILSEKSE